MRRSHDPTTRSERTGHPGPTRNPGRVPRPEPPRRRGTPAPSGPRARPAIRAAGALVALALSAGLLPGCTGSDAADSRLAVDRGEFIEVMVALRDTKLELEQQDSVPEGRFDALRDSILAAHGVEPAELYAFVNAHPDLEYQEALWDSINRRLKRPLAPPKVTGRRSGLPDSVEGLQQPPKPGGGIQRLGPDGR